MPHDAQRRDLDNQKTGINASAQVGAVSRERSQT
jgi:hypothetical protein